MKDNLEGVFGQQDVVLHKKVERLLNEHIHGEEGKLKTIHEAWTNM
jgi:hypothetical protein